MKHIPASILNKLSILILLCLGSWGLGPGTWGLGLGLVSAQPAIFINPVQPSGNFMHYQDLWALSITKEPVNLAMGNPFYFLEIEIGEGKNSLSLWKAHTQLFHIVSSPYWISPGSPAELEPVEVVFSNGQWYENITVGGGLFPPGEYTITYRLFEPPAGGSSGGILRAIASYKKNISGTYPPILIFPFDNDTVNTEPVVFTWVPPYPLYPSQEITYELRLAEVLGKQKPIPAITTNTLFFSTQEIELTQYVYPPDARPLTPGVRYAWQILAYDGNTVAGYSPVWSFTAGENEIPRTPVVIPDILFDLSSPAQSVYYTVDTNFIAFRYREDYNDTDASLNYVLRNDTRHETASEGKVNPFAVAKGMNVYVVYLHGLPLGYYTLTVKNEKNSVSHLKFNYKLR